MLDKKTYKGEDKGAAGGEGYTGIE